MAPGIWGSQARRSSLTQLACIALTRLGTQSKLTCKLLIDQSDVRVSESLSSDTPSKVRAESPRGVIVRVFDSAVRWVLADFQLSIVSILPGSMCLSCVPYAGPPLGSRNGRGAHFQFRARGLHPRIIAFIIVLRE